MSRATKRESCPLCKRKRIRENFAQLGNKSLVEVGGDRDVRVPIGTEGKTEINGKSVQITNGKEELFTIIDELPTI